MATALCVYDLLIENYGKHLTSSNWSTPLSESRARNLSSPVFVVCNNTVVEASASAMLNVASLFLGLHFGQQLGEAHVESSGCLVEVDDATLRWLRLTPPMKSCGRRPHQAELGGSRPFTTKRGKSLDAFALSLEIGQQLQGPAAPGPAGHEV